MPDIPLTVLGGFLGAGKTTALNRILADAVERVGVLVNDFGAIAVDAALVASRDGDVLALANGCVCCALGPDLGDSLMRLAARNPPPDRIVVEASGVSDPWRIAQLARLEAGILLDAVIVLVDATSFVGHLADSWLADTLERQLARADLIVVSKSDLVDPTARTATRQAIRRIRPDARVAETMPGTLLALADPTIRRSTLGGALDDHGFRTWHWRGGALDRTRLADMLGALPASVLRAKGVCLIGPLAMPHLLQLAGVRWTLEPWDGDAEPAIVLIGTPALPGAEDLQERFDSCRI